MVGALAVLLVAVGGFSLVRAVGRDDLDVPTEEVEYLSVVEVLQQSGHQVAYPPAPPTGWTATSVDSEPGEQLVFGLGFLTTNGTFAGIRQESSSLKKLVETYVDADAAAGESVAAGTGELQGQWQTFTDSGGDTALGLEGPSTTVLVYGSASRSDLVALVDSLTLDPVTPRG